MSDSKTKEKETIQKNKQNEFDLEELNNLTIQDLKTLATQYKYPVTKNALKPELIREIIRASNPQSKITNVTNNNQKIKTKRSYLTQSSSKTINQNKLEGHLKPIGSYADLNPNSKMYLTQKNPNVIDATLISPKTQGAYVNPNLIDTSFSKPVSNVIHRNYKGKGGYWNRVKHGVDTMHPDSINFRQTPQDEGMVTVNSYFNAPSFKPPTLTQPISSFQEDYYQEIAKEQLIEDNQGQSENNDDNFLVQNPLYIYMASKGNF